MRYVAKGKEEGGGEKVEKHSTEVHRRERKREREKTNDEIERKYLKSSPLSCEEIPSPNPTNPLYIVYTFGDKDRRLRGGEAESP